MAGKKFTRTDEWHLQAAEGWLGLGDMPSAHAELDAITPALREHSTVLLLRCDICSKAKDWETMARIGGRLVELFPKERHGWVHRSYALHELKRTQEAHDLLHPAVKLFPKFWLVPYNLACYCAQLGQLPEAREWLAKAEALGDKFTVPVMARQDPDLKPLWAGSENP